MKDAESLTNDLTDAEMVQRLVDAGWRRSDAEKEVKKMIIGSEVEDGYEGY